jgi:hypothetical protein
MASQHCLDVGGKHVEPRHMRLMLACAEICRTSAYFMELGTEFHKRTSAVCAEVCEECARSCEAVGDMAECIEACRRGLPGIPCMGGRLNLSQPWPG